MQVVKPKDLKRLVQNQKREKNKAPITQRAVFKLSELQKLIRQISRFKREKSIDYVDICITFVRANEEDAKKYGLCVMNPAEKDLKSVTTQLIPIIVPCIIKPPSLNDGIKSFKYMRRKDGQIPFIRPGGEGTGLIPPPPKPDEDFV